MTYGLSNDVNCKGKLSSQRVLQARKKSVCVCVCVCVCNIDFVPVVKSSDIHMKTACKKTSRRKTKA